MPAPDRSNTFHALVKRLEAGDVVVYLQYGQLPSGLHGRLTFLTEAVGLRYVMVEVSRELDTPRLIAIVGHELQHAVEILDQPQIVSRRHLRRVRANRDSNAATSRMEPWASTRTRPSTSDDRSGGNWPDRQWNARNALAEAFRPPSQNVTREIFVADDVGQHAVDVRLVDGE